MEVMELTYMQWKMGECHRDDGSNASSGLGGSCESDISDAVEVGEAEKVIEVMGVMQAMELGGQW